MSFISNDTRGAFIIIAVSLPWLFAVFMVDLENIANYHGDETYWVYVGSNSFQLFFVKRDFSNPFWQDPYFTFGTNNPQIGKYLIGAGTYFAGYEDIPSKLFNFGQDNEWNLAQGNILAPKIVAAARTPIALLGLASCVLLYWLTTLVTDHWNGIIAVGFLVGSRLLLQSSRRAMVDTPALFFGLLALVCMVYLLRALHKGNIRLVLILAVWIGIVCGLAVGAKMNALLVLGICSLALSFECVRSIFQRHQFPLWSVWSIGILVLCAWLIFFASNPSLYNDPARGVKQILNLSQFVAAASIPASTPTLEAKLRAVVSNTLWFAPLNQAGLPGDGGLLLVGFIGLGIAAWRSPRDVWDSSLGFVALWVIVSFVGIGLWVPLNWDRFFLPLQPCGAFVEAHGTVWVLKNIRLFWMRRMERAKP